jgi:putative spermidine/putrescine transport system permease protein
MRASSGAFGVALASFNAVVYVFLLAPIIVIVISSFGSTGFLAFPPQGLSLRWYVSALGNQQYWSAFQTSIGIALTVAVLATLIGGMASVALVRIRFPGRGLLTALFLSPLMLPTLVLALAILLLSSQLHLEASTARLIAAHLVVTVPYVLRTSMPVLQRVDRALEEAAQDLGANPTSAFFLVTLPMVRSGLLAGALFAFMISFDELVLALFLANPRSPTLPIKIYSAVQLGLDPTVAAIATLLIGLSVLGLLIGQAVVGVRRLF